eukprot:13134171-Ditylum_brightwellii.AAC.1
MPNGSCPLSSFSLTDVQQMMKDKHPVFCPVYKLQSRLQNRQAYPKWDSRARLGMNLGYPAKR